MAALEGTTPEELRVRCAGVFAEPLRDPRLPPAETILTAVWEGHEYAVRVLDNGFEHAGQFFGSLHNVTRVITDGEIHDGFVFFRLVESTTGCDARSQPSRDPRLPPPGSILTRIHRGTQHRVLVLDAGFEYQGQSYGSLSRIARTITGTAWNGFVFFDLAVRKAPRSTGGPPDWTVGAVDDAQRVGGHDALNVVRVANTHSTADDGQNRLADAHPSLDATRPRPARDPRLPPPGAVLTRIHGDVAHAVHITETGFEYEGRRYRSLSGIARAITGTNWNGYLFFGLTVPRPPPAKTDSPDDSPAQDTAPWTDATTSRASAWDRGLEGLDSAADFEDALVLGFGGGAAAPAYAPATVV